MRWDDVPIRWDDVPMYWDGVLKRWDDVPMRWDDVPMCRDDVPKCWGGVPKCWDSVPMCRDDVPKCWDSMPMCWGDVLKRWDDVLKRWDDVPDSWRNTPCITDICTETAAVCRQDKYKRMTRNWLRAGKMAVEVGGKCRQSRARRSPAACAAAFLEICCWVYHSGMRYSPCKYKYDFAKSNRKNTEN